MFENVLPENTVEVIDILLPEINDFYLAGGTGLAVQIGHRESADLDFFTAEVFNTDFLLDKLQPDKTLLVNEGTVHCELRGIKLSFLFYSQPLIYPAINWRNLSLADWRDITAEKFKTVAQRGSKKDFYDLFAVLQLKLPIDEACKIFKKRFSSANMNMYHVLKSLTFFEEADEEPSPVLLMKEQEWQWEKVKDFFEDNIKQFEKYLIK